jgi:hypothetical protein
MRNLTTSPTKREEEIIMKHSKCINEVVDQYARTVYTQLPLALASITELTPNDVLAAPPVLEFKHYLPDGPFLDEVPLRGDLKLNAKNMIGIRTLEHQIKILDHMADTKPSPLLVSGYDGIGRSVAIQIGILNQLLANKKSALMIFPDHGRACEKELQLEKLLTKTSLQTGIVRAKHMSNSPPGEQQARLVLATYTELRELLNSEGKLKDSLKDMDFSFLYVDRLETYANFADEFRQTYLKLIAELKDRDGILEVVPIMTCGSKLPKIHTSADHMALAKELIGIDPSEFTLVDATSKDIELHTKSVYKKHDGRKLEIDYDIIWKFLRLLKEKPRSLPELAEALEPYFDKSTEDIITMIENIVEVAEYHGVGSHAIP